MGSIYQRRRRLWLAFKGLDGKRVLRSSGLLVGEEKKARALLERLEAAVAEDRADGLLPITVAAYAAKWGEARKKLGQTNAGKDLARVERYVLPAIGSMLLTEVRPRHIRGLIASLRRPERDLAPRTIISIAGLLRRLLADADSQELIDGSPYKVKRGELPKKRDKNPEWRAGARFSRDEVEQLISDPRVPEDRRVVYALAFLTGMREGEIAALRWRCFEHGEQPLPAIHVSKSYTRVNKAEKPTKTGAPRAAPMHPTLAKVIARWRLSGWARWNGRPPLPDDLVVPNARGTYRTDNTYSEGLNADLAALGLRHRTMHNMRRTFVSLGRADGANPAVLKTVSHDHTMAEQFDMYTTFTHADRCEAVLKLRISLREGQLLRLAASSRPPSPPLDGAADTATRPTTRDGNHPSQLAATACPGRDSNPPEKRRSRTCAENSAENFCDADEGGHRWAAACSSVASGAYRTWDEQMEAGHA